MKQHKQNCGINISCLVYHPDGVCDHPSYGKCTCDGNDTNFYMTPKNNEEKCECGICKIGGICSKEVDKIFTDELSIKEEEKWCGHMSDCAVHNEPAEPNGKCNCKSPRKYSPSPKAPLQWEEAKEIIARYAESDKGRMMLLGYIKGLLKEQNLSLIKQLEAEKKDAEQIRDIYFKGVTGKPEPTEIWAEIINAKNFHNAGIQRVIDLLTKEK